MLVGVLFTSSLADIAGATLREIIDGGEENRRAIQERPAVGWIV